MLAVGPEVVGTAHVLTDSKVPAYVETTTLPPNPGKEQLRREGFGIHRYAYDDDDSLKSLSSGGAQGVDDDTA